MSKLNDDETVQAALSGAQSRGLVVQFADLPALLYAVTPIVDPAALRAEIGEAFADPPSAWVVAYCPETDVLREGAYHIVGLPESDGEPPTLSLILVVRDDVLAAVEAGLRGKED